MKKKNVQMKIPAAVKNVLKDTQKFVDISQKKPCADLVRIVLTSAKQKSSQVHMQKKSLSKKRRK